MARYLPLGEYATALGDGPICAGVPDVGNSTKAPGTGGAPEIAPSGVGVAFAAGVGVAVGDGAVVADAGITPSVLTTAEPSGA
jgi:hypothetical protein